MSWKVSWTESLLNFTLVNSCLLLKSLFQLAERCAHGTDSSHEDYPRVDHNLYLCCVYIYIIHPSAFTHRHTCFHFLLFHERPLTVSTGFRSLKVLPQVHSPLVLPFLLSPAHKAKFRLSSSLYCIPNVTTFSICMQVRAPPVFPRKFWVFWGIPINKTWQFGLMRGRNLKHFNIFHQKSILKFTIIVAKRVG
jgi:hypothetical protein